MEGMRRVLCGSVIGLSACTPATLGSVGAQAGTGSEGDGEVGTEGEGEGGPDLKFDVGPGGVCGGDLGSCPNKVDLLFVIDNSGTMGEEQLNLARNFPTLIQELQQLENEDGQPVGADVNIMVTTTDFGHPLCTNFAKHPPEQGAPVSSGCNERIDRFVPLDEGDPPVFEACTDACPVDLVPEDHFIHFDTRTHESNVPDVEPADINDDGELDDAVAQTLACIAPQGVDGCGYEAPLENMLQAINPAAWWNSGEKGQRPFLRHDAILALVLITDEADCSVLDYEIFTPDGPDGTQWWNDKPGMGPLPSSAVCWNAGVECGAPDPDGVYPDCTSRDEPLLQPVSRYVDHLVQTVRGDQGKEVVMLGILGVPPVERDEDGEPVGGGLDALEIRDWRDPEYPTGDILPEDWPEEDAAFKQWLFGIGPGCTGTDGMGEFTGQAIPPVRIREVCQALDTDDGVRCCIESICDTDLRPALRCLTDVIQNAIVPVK
jgi:hypothetical protein